MKPYHKNPRQITGKQIKDLGVWLFELGDLSGIVHDLNTDEIIGGNQRGRVFNVNECDVELVDGPHEPDEQGTVAHGFIVWKGKRYAYRQVRWDERQAEKANIVANKAGGGWDFDLLADQFEVSDLIEWGFAPYELGLVEGNDPNAEWEGMPEFEQDDLTAIQSIHVHFATRADVDTFAELIGQKLTDRTQAVWYPAAQIERYADKRYSDES